MFTNQEPITVDVFKQPMVEQVLASAPDVMTIASDFQKNVVAMASFVAQNEANRAAVDNIIKMKAIPALVQFIRSYGDKRGGWTATTGKPTGFGDDYWFRTAANFAGIWWNTNGEVVYYIGEKDQDGEELNGSNSYVLNYRPDDLPPNHVHAYWSLTLMSLPDYRVVPNELQRYNLNNIAELQYEEDGSLRIHLAGELPAGAPESNWLPAPKGKPFTLNHRLYVPKPEVLTGEWYVPPIEKVK
jgi:hypothetical protein